MALCRSALHLLLFLGLDLDPRREAAGERAGEPPRRRLDRAAPAHLRLRGPSAVGGGGELPTTIVRRPVAVSAGASSWELTAPPAAGGGGLPPRRRWRRCHDRTVRWLLGQRACLG